MGKRLAIAYRVLLISCATSLTHVSVIGVNDSWIVEPESNVTIANRNPDLFTSNHNWPCTYT